MDSTQGKGTGIYAGFVGASLALLAVAYFSPIWWVSLKAPQYPEHTFPHGVRIHMHFDGVHNGCKLMDRAEVDEDEALDCVHEMNTINHYIGMHPIEQGAQVEFALAPYLFVAMGLLLIASVFYTGAGWWILCIPGILLPVVFLIDFSAWLWWFGHNLHPWAAFTVKPFMPTVLGQGKVAQFSTYSYPHYGFGLIVLSSFLLLIATLLRRKKLLEAAAGQQ